MHEGGPIKDSKPQRRTQLLISQDLQLLSCQASTRAEEYVSAEAEWFPCRSTKITRAVLLSSVQKSLYIITADKATKTCQCPFGRWYSWNVEVEPLASPRWISHTHRSATRLQHCVCACRHVCAVQVCLYTITIDYNGPLKAANCYSDDDIYDLVSGSTRRC